MSYEHKQYHRKNKYWSIVFIEGRPTPLKYRMVSKGFRAFYYWLQNNYPNWTAINVYNRLPNSQRGSFVGQLTKQNYYQQIQYL